MFENLHFETFCGLFDSEQACVDSMFAARWPEGFRCPVCNHGDYYLIQSRRLPLYECRSCRHQTSITAGTIMEKSRTPLTRWFQAMFLMSQEFGISAVDLSRIIEVTYKTAWLIAHKIRHAMQQADLDQQLAGFVRVDRHSYGYANYHDAKQPLVVGGSLNGTRDQLQHVKIKQPDPNHVNHFLRTVTAEGLDSFVKEHVAPGAETQLQRGVRHSALNRIGLSAGRWLNDTFHGIGAKHLQAYLDEFCFRLNLKFGKVPVFGRLLEWCTSTNVLIYKELTKIKPILRVPWVVWGSKAKWKGRHMYYWTV